MATSALIGALRVTLGLDSAAFEKGADRATRSMGRFRKDVGGLNSQLSGLTRSLRGMGVALAGAFGVREIVSLVDSANKLQAQLKLATRESGNFAVAQADVNRIALETRSSLEATAQLYATFQRNSRELGITQWESARATETVTKAFRISGASAAEAAGGLRQFLQGLQSGVLRGEELNSVLENAPRLARLLADGLGVTIGQLRAMGAEGKLSADILIAALTDRKFTESIDEEFKELPVTFGEAMENVTSAATIAFGAFDRGGGFSQALSTFVTDGVKGFADLGHAATELGIDIRSTFEGLRNVFQPMLDGARSVFGSIEAESRSLADRVRPLLGEIDAITRGAQRVNVFGIRGDWLSETNLLDRFDEAQARSEAERRSQLSLGNGWRAALDQMISSVGRPGGVRGAGGGAGGSSRRDRTGDFAYRIQGLSEEIENAFSRENTPHAIRWAEALRSKIEDIAESARKAGVPMSQFSDQIAVMRARISELEIEGLASEAASFSREVEDMTKTVKALDLGALSPLEQRLLDVDDRYESLRQSIQEQIDENAVLAVANEDAAKAMAELVALLARVDAAHTKAAEAARAQYEAEQQLRNLSAAQAGQRIGEQIDDLRTARGDNGLLTSNQREQQQLERELQAERLDALIQLSEYEARQDEARRAGDEQEVMRLQGLINLQGEYYDLVSQTTAEQIITSQRLQDAYQDFTDGLSDALYDMVVRFDFSLRSIGDVFLKLINDIFLRPATDQLASSIGGFLKSAFAGGFATGGVIPRGQWGIVGERGPEPIFAADGPLRVMPNETLGGGGAVFNITVNGAMSDRDARRTGNQIGSAAIARMSAARKAGIAG